jgi:hypothetical protein
VRRQAKEGPKAIYSKMSAPNSPPTSPNSSLSPYLSKAVAKLLEVDSIENFDQEYQVMEKIGQG